MRQEWLSRCHAPLRPGGWRHVTSKVLLSLLGVERAAVQRTAWHLTKHSKRRKLLASRSCPCLRRPCCTCGRHMPLEEVARVTLASLPGRATCPRGCVSVGGDSKRPSESGWRRLLPREQRRGFATIRRSVDGCDKVATCGNSTVS